MDQNPDNIIVVKMTTTAPFKNCGIQNECADSKKAKRKFKIPKTIQRPKGLENLNIDDIQIYTPGMSKRTLRRLIENGTLIRSPYIKTPHITAESFFTYLKERGCRILEEESAQKNQT